MSLGRRVVVAKHIQITAQPVVMEAELNDSRTAEAIWNALPIDGRANLWGDEIYFSTGLQIAAEDPLAVVEVGDLAYWPPGTAFCLFFGRTPASHGDEARPASPVNVFGRLKGHPEDLKRVKHGTPIRIERVSG
jgi:hypothetical protein